jgi:hypothetical protein
MGVLEEKMTILVALIMTGVCTFVFDYLMFKWEEQKEIDVAWKALNEQLEREGKQRWDKRH